MLYVLTFLKVSRLSNGFDHSSPSVPSSIRQRIVHQKSISSANASPASSYVLKQSTPGSAKETEIKLKVTSRREKDVRKELFRMVRIGTLCVWFGCVGIRW